MTLDTIEASIRRVARRMDDLDPRKDREEWMDLCRERQALQAQRWATLRAAQVAQQLDPWADAWEDGRPAEPPQATRGGTAQPGGSPGATACVEDAPDWPDAPTEEIRIHEDTRLCEITQV